MILKKRVKRIIGWLAGLSLLFLAVLMTHIVIMVIKMPRPSNPTVQMARADFKQYLDSTNAEKLQARIRSLKGVESTYFNQKDQILIYTFDNRVNTARHIYDQAIKPAGFTSERYTVSADDLSTGCPVMDNHSIYGKVTAFVAKVIH